MRKIDSPASEPVDLAGMAGPAILKRLAPVVGGLLLLLFVLRRRRSLSGPAGPMDGDDVARVTALLGRPPQGPFEVRRPRR